MEDGCRQRVIVAPDLLKGLLKPVAHSLCVCGTDHIDLNPRTAQQIAHGVCGGFRCDCGDILHPAVFAQAKGFIRTHGGLALLQCVLALVAQLAVNLFL